MSDLLDPGIWRAVYHCDEFYETQFRAGWMTPLLACESGSRAWGFASKDSDYDVRFIYCRPTRYYLSLQPRPDTVSVTLDTDSGPIDAVGWDISKLLKLVAKSNASSFEWLFACPRYYVNEAWFTTIEMAVLRHLDPIRVAHHYRSMAIKHWDRYISGKDEVTYKKYLYALRSIWSVEWYIRTTGPVAPINFLELMWGSDAPANVKDLVNNFVATKQAGKEFGMAKPNELLNDYIQDSISVWRDGFGNKRPYVGVSWEMLNNAFKHTLALIDLQRSERYFKELI